MMIQLELGPEFQKTINELTSMGEAIFGACSRGLGKAVKFMANYVVVNFLSGQALKRRTSQLAREVDGWMIEPLEGVVGVPEKSTVSTYKWLLGGESKTIVPKKGKALTIPIGEALTGAGVAKWASVKQAEDALGVDIFRPRGSNVLGYIRGKSKLSKFRPLFVLVKSVFIQGSDALLDGVLESQDQATDILQEEVDKVVT